MTERKLPKFGGSPYQYAKDLRDAGVGPEEMLQLVIKTGLGDAQAKIIVNSVGVQEPPSTAPRRAARPKAPTAPSAPVAAATEPKPARKPAEKIDFKLPPRAILPGLICATGTIVTLGSCVTATHVGVPYIIAWAAIVLGGWRFVREMKRSS